MDNDKLQRANFLSQEINRNTEILQLLKAVPVTDIYMGCHKMHTGSEWTRPLSNDDIKKLVGVSQFNEIRELVRSMLIIKTEKILSEQQQEFDNL